MNHSDNPNCKLVAVYGGQDSQGKHLAVVMVESIRPVKDKEELTWRYAPPSPHTITRHYQRCSLLPFWFSYRPQAGPWDEAGLERLHDADYLQRLLTLHSNTLMGKERGEGWLCMGKPHTSPCLLLLLASSSCAFTHS